MFAKFMQLTVKDFTIAIRNSVDKINYKLKCVFSMLRNFDGRVNGIETVAQIALSDFIFTNRCLLQRGVREYFERRQSMSCCHLSLLTKNE